MNPRTGDGWAGIVPGTVDSVVIEPVQAGKTITEGHREDGRILTLGRAT